jgi:PAT family beta-lactamase induction signal transducer AmpG
VLVGVAATLWAREPQAALEARLEAEVHGSPMERLYETARRAFADFLARDAALAILAFVILFKLCDALAGTMTAPFVLSLGYTKAMYAAIVKGVGLGALLVGGFAGGVVARALPLSTALWIAAFLQMFSNLVFVWLGYQTPSAGALTVAIIVENFAGAIGTVIFVAYLSALCRNPLHTATQYALLTALASTGRTLFSAGTGFAAAFLGWTWFFIGTSLTAVPALLLMVWLQGRGHFRALENERNGS